ncbi:MAG TPA: hypothetical protein VEP90_29025, partial [Methylomirabilota bacterium]|nr:hypothetical protein [Methylomirabilota bacterium]
MINLIDFMQDIVQVLRATEDPAEKAAMIADLVLGELPEMVALVARRCIILHWFDLPIIEALLKN